MKLTEILNENADSKYTSDRGWYDTGTQYIDGSTKQGKRIEVKHLIKEKGGKLIINPSCDSLRIHGKAGTPKFVFPFVWDAKWPNPSMHFNYYTGGFHDIIIEDFTEFPKQIAGINMQDNVFAKSLLGIDKLLELKHIRFNGEFEYGILRLLKCKKLESISWNEGGSVWGDERYTKPKSPGEKALFIFYKHLVNKSMPSIPEFQGELIDAGLEEYAKL